MISPMTTSLQRPPLAIPQLPASWGKARGREYQQLTQEYQACPESEVHLALVTIARFLCAAPRSTERIALAAWGQVRAWNHDWMTASTDLCAETTVVCGFCGEFREGALVGEATIMSHMAPIRRHGRAVFVEPSGCEHHGFEIVCNTCEARWTDAIAVVAVSEPEAPNPEKLSSMSPPSEYGPN